MATEEKKELVNPPLKEAIFEVKWDNQKIGPASRKDSKLLAGIFLERIKNDYSFHEPLGLAQAPIPDEAIQGLAQHRFRVAQGAWPLVQIGSGVLTVNETAGYSWQDFKSRVLRATQTLCEVYPIGEAVTSISLRYLNTLKVDFEKTNPFEFLRSQMSLDVGLSQALLEAGKVEIQPSNFNFKFSHQSNEPGGGISIMFATGKDAGKDVLVWEISFHAQGGDTPVLPGELEAWLEVVHEKIEIFFFTMGKNILE